MKTGATPGSGPAEGGERERGSPPEYEPPAIAWEEAFESVSATSCGQIAGLADQCSAKPVT